MPMIPNTVAGTFVEETVIEGDEKYTYRYAVACWDTDSGLPYVITSEGLKRLDDNEFFGAATRHIHPPLRGDYAALQGHPKTEPVR